MRQALTIAVICMATLSRLAVAGPVTFSGYLNDPTNAALIGSDLGPPLFSNDFEIANNVALYSLSLSVAGAVTFDSNGFAAGGADPYFTLFAGSGSGATFLGSNYAQAFSTGGDFNLTFALAAGDYTIALGAFANMSFAENTGVGSLGDGFIGLGQPSFLGNYYYELAVTEGPAPPISEPGSLALFLASSAAFLALRRTHVRPTERSRTATSIRERDHEPTHNA